MASLNIDGSTDPVTLTVASSSSFPAVGNFRILIDSEILLVTSVSGANFTADRAQEGTSIASHLIGATVTGVLTAGSLIQLANNFNIYDTFANRPSAGIKGRRFKATDNPFEYYDNGTTWDKYFLGFKLTTYPSSGWTWDNQDVWTATDAQDMLCLQNITSASSNIHAYYRTAPTPPYSITAAFLVTPMISQTDMEFGLAWRSSGDSKLSTFDRQFETTLKFGAYKWTNTSSFASQYFDRIQVAEGGPLVFLRLRDDNTNRYWEFSYDGVNYMEWFHQSRTDFHTPDQVAVFAAGNNNSSICLIHWEVG